MAWGRPDPRKQDRDKAQQNMASAKPGPATPGPPQGDALETRETQTVGAKGSNSEIEITLSDDEVVEVEHSTLGQEDRVRPSKRRNEVRWRTRGSLQEGGEIERHSRVTDLRIPNPRKFFKPKKELKVMPDVYIPNVLSVSQLAKILNVKLGLMLSLCFPNMTANR